MMLLTHSPQKILARDTLWGKSSNFLLTTWLSRPKTYHKAVYKSNTSRLSDPKENIILPSSGIRRKQNFEIVFGFKSHTAVWTFLSALANPPPPLLSLFSFLWWALKRLHLDKNTFGKAFVVFRLRERKYCFVVKHYFFLFIYSFCSSLIFCSQKTKFISVSTFMKLWTCSNIFYLLSDLLFALTWQ